MCTPQVCRSSSDSHGKPLCLKVFREKLEVSCEMLPTPSPGANKHCAIRMIIMSNVWYAPRVARTWWPNGTCRFLVDCLCLGTSVMVVVVC